MTVKNHFRGIKKNPRESDVDVHDFFVVVNDRWSAIAARLPGRTDNEIKNVWHTHLKKRLQKKQQHQGPITNNNNRPPRLSSPPPPPPPPRESASSSSDDTSSTTTTTNMCEKMEPSSSNNNNNINNNNTQDFAEIEDNFWTDVLSFDDTMGGDHFSAVIGTDDPGLSANVGLELSSSSSSSSPSLFNAFSFSSNNIYYDNMDFWYNLSPEVGDSPEMLPQL